jgi:hypothetical protein
MNNNRLGCLSTTAILASLISILVIGGYVFFNGNVFFTAGALNAEAGEVLGGASSHADVGKSCEKCHTAPWDKATMGDRCMDCHAEIRQQLATADSMHAQMVKDLTLKCQDCHTEHRGPTAPITHMVVGHFPHDTTGFSLASHIRQENGAVFTCVDCHGDDITRFDPAVCQQCHANLDGAFSAAHEKAYGTDCQGCHDGRESLNKEFNHARTAFKLAGKHVSVLCEKCHINVRKAADFKNLDSKCVACHQKDDEHGGKFGTDCERCHSVESWEDSTFDHSTAKFKLDGKHTSADCESCHSNGVFEGTPTTCIGCHQKDDEHAGNLGQDCAACHTTAGWKPATFDHSKADFKLDGEHSEVACEKCHLTKAYKDTPSACYACHEKDDDHKGKYGKDCAACHSTNGWKPATFDHNLSKFRLDGGHANVTCEKCHPNARFAGTPLVCEGCHSDPAYHSGMFNQSCSSCHNTSAWLPATYNGPHSFPMNHGGKNNTCGKCHQPTLKQSSCYTCHNQREIESEHREENIGNFGDCLRCHPNGQSAEDGDGGGGGDGGGDGDGGGGED